MDWIMLWIGTSLTCLENKDRNRFLYCTYSCSSPPSEIILYIYIVFAGNVQTIHSDTPSGDTWKFALYVTTRVRFFRWTKMMEQKHKKPLKSSEMISEFISVFGKENSVITVQHRLQYCKMYRLYIENSMLTSLYTVCNSAISENEGKRLYFKAHSHEHCRILKDVWRISQKDSSS